ncbi:MAG: DNA primase family protein, partial [Aggregatilineales bacterium]
PAEPVSVPQVKPDLMDLAHAWKQRFANEWAWDTKVSTWRHWTGTHWQLEREPETLDLLAVEVMRLMGVPVSSGSKIDSVIRLARALSKRQFAPARRQINFQNGTLDLDTLTGHLHTASDNLTSCLPYDYDRNGEYPAIARFLGHAIPDKDGQRAYMAHIGLALIGDTTLHKALVLIGPPRSGKTTLLKLAQRTLGVPPGQFPSAILFSSESRGANSRATWLDQSPHLVCLDEFPEEAVRDEGEEIFKSMSAHGGVSMWLKYRDERAENTWTAKLMFATNNRMRYRDPSGALTRRLLVVECPNSLPDERLDGTLLDKFVPELGGFAAACIKLALQVLDTRTYPESAAMRALLGDIERNGDAVKLWLSENCTFEVGAFTPTQALYNNFRSWCEENGLHPVSRPKLRDMMCGYQPGIRCTKQRTIDVHSGATKPMWGMVGVRLRSGKDDLTEESAPVG